jgi:hypothetical protein
MQWSHAHAAMRHGIATFYDTLRHLMTFSARFTGTMVKNAELCDLDNFQKLFENKKNGQIANSTQLFQG